MQIALANLSLLSVTGPKMPPDLKSAMEKTVTAKQDVIDWLKRSLDAVTTAHANVDGMYLRIIVHANEHMGQLIAYARMSGVVPPWSAKTGGED
jgi:hypothetical protein